MQPLQRLAAVDLGSNSFRLEIGVIEHGVFRRTEYLKETVRQGGGLDENRNLTPAAMQKGWECLARFGERLAGFDADEVRAVATQTLREARNRDEFLDRANTLLGFPINVISGREEARLIYQGVAHMLDSTTERRLVMDIGGRSTELILGEGHTPKTMESFRVGSIAWSTRFFPEGQFTQRAFEVAEIAAKAVLDEALDLYQPDRWDVAYGSAGTVNAITEVLEGAGWEKGSITRAGLDWLVEKLIAAQSADKLRLPGLRDDRRPIIGGGVSVIRAVFDLLGIETMHIAPGGLRHGLLCDMLGPHTGLEDLQTRSINRLAMKFNVDLAHGERVGRVARTLLSQLFTSQSEPERQRLLQKLEWAGQLHEVGVHISHSDSHKHGAYILDNADAMGFSLSEMHRLSLLVLGHRGKLRKLESAMSDPGLVMQMLALRIAVILCHARRDPDLDGFRLTWKKESQKVTVSVRNRWSDLYPQSAHLLREEALAWAQITDGLRLDTGSI
ncbi:Ppx/GppA phosphatase family protein [Curvibacter sp. APW13]|uniref:Ppx/GppA phosphatase family protein n=1 Tax=Curvibacter sp. APW13 TaxID=3077236 RepID=UPI0028DDFDBF|nr:Ppx/GppA phosphatase family protein [Curvibacter sp. APW13]MDT8992202.1 Ppx/GppA phosphatase family protein [Curvibacter sp. APW13]